MNAIDLTDVRSYATEANLLKGLANLGLDAYTDTDKHGNTVTCRYMVVRTPEGRWTAIFLASQFLNACGGYIGFASQHGFMSV